MNSPVPCHNRRPKHCDSPIACCNSSPQSFKIAILRVRTSSVMWRGLKRRRGVTTRPYIYIHTHTYICTHIYIHIVHEDGQTGWTNEQIGGSSSCGLLLLPQGSNLLRVLPHLIRKHRQCSTSFYSDVLATSNSW